VDTLECLADFREDCEVLLPVSVINQLLNLVFFLLVQANINVNLNLVKQVHDHDDVDFSLCWGKVERGGFNRIPNDALEDVESLHLL